MHTVENLVTSFMLIISSSAKTLDFETSYSAKVEPASPVFLETAAELHDVLEKMDFAELKKLLGVNEKLAVLNFERMQMWSSQHADQSHGGNSRPAMFAYKGDVFRQLTPTEYSKSECEYAARSLFVMSGLYGAVGAFDLIQPYRLEMATELNGERLSSFWKEVVTDHFNELIRRNGHKVLLDLASKEYSAAVDMDSLECPVVKVDFKECKDGKLKIMGIYSKRARGMMIDFCIRHQVKNVEDIKKFNEGGYEFHGEGNGRYVFVR